jgi:hypothetical protein
MRLSILLVSFIGTVAFGKPFICSGPLEIFNSACMDAAGEPPSHVPSSDITCPHPGWFCASRGITALCHKFHTLLGGRVCGEGTCCSVDSLGFAACSREACEQYDKGTDDEEKLAVTCKEPGWTCPYNGIMAFCNKHNKLSDGKVCAKGTCCELDSTGFAACVPCQKQGANKVVNHRELGL